MSVLQENRHIGLQRFLTNIQKYRDIDKEKLALIAETTIKYLNSNTEQRQKIQYDQALEQRWYQGLKEGFFDYDVYNTDDYIAELWACWIVYSKRHLLNITKINSLPPIGIANTLHPLRKILDLGCGFGYTTAAIKELFPNAEVTGTNLDNTIQMDVAKHLSKEYNFNMVSDVNELSGQYDLIFASEYFEHIHEPIEHLDEIVGKLNPKAFLIANSFGTQAVGHFHTYLVNGSLIDGKATSRIFNNQLRRYGYQKIKTKLWNNRPAYWRKYK